METDEGVRYDVIHLDESEPVDAIGIYDVDEGEVLEFYEMDELVEEVDAV